MSSTRKLLYDDGLGPMGRIEQAAAGTLAGLMAGKLPLLPWPDSEIASAFKEGMDAGIHAKEECIAYERNKLPDWVPEAIRKNSRHKDVCAEMLSKLNTLIERVKYVEEHAPKGTKDKDRMQYTGIEHACQYSDARRKLGLAMKKVSRRTKHM